MSEPKPDPKADRDRDDPDGASEIPGDTDAADIVGPTGEEMPEVAHDHGDAELPDDRFTG
jgi:hypothetical protein